MADTTGPGPLSGGMKSSPAGRAGIQAVSLLGEKFGMLSPAPSAASAGQSTAAQTIPASLPAPFTMDHPVADPSYRGKPAVKNDIWRGRRYDRALFTPPE